MSARICLIFAAILGFLAVLLGAFGAHGLAGGGDKPGYLESKYAATDAKTVAGMEVPAAYKYLRDFRTGVRYHMWHALALLATGVIMLSHPSRLLSAAAWCYVSGTILFSGSLYVLVIAGPKSGGITWGLVAPVGGTLLLLGWLLLVGACVRLYAQPEPLS